MAVLMGGPNMVRGSSHNGNVSARELAERGTLDILSSDYIPASLLYAALVMEESVDAITLPQAIATVTRNPARQIGLSDRGEIAHEKRADMVRFQRLTGVRPSEVCIIRPGDVERSDDVWQYRPESHKTEHHGRERVIFIGPKAQDVLRPYLLRPAEAYCFSPAESIRRFRAEQGARRKTNVQPSQQDRRRPRPRRTPRDHYTKDSYNRAIRRVSQPRRRLRSAPSSRRVDPAAGMTARTSCPPAGGDAVRRGRRPSR